MRSYLLETINYHIKNRMLLKVERKDISSEPYVGFPIELTDTFLIMTNIYDFHDEGYILLKTEDITDAYSKNDDEFYEKVCKCEKLHNKTEHCPIKSFKDIKDVLLELSDFKGYITIYCEKETKDCNFFLGKIREISDKGVSFASIGCDGEWNDEIDFILFEKITMIAFGDFYSNMFYKYVR